MDENVRAENIKLLKLADLLDDRHMLRRHLPDMERFDRTQLYINNRNIRELFAVVPQPVNWNEQTAAENIRLHVAHVVARDNFKPMIAGRRNGKPTDTDKTSQA